MVVWSLHKLKSLKSKLFVTAGKVGQLLTCQDKTG